MVKKPEDKAREDIDRMLEKAGWDVQDIDHINIHARQGIAIQDFPLKPGHGFADYILYIDGKAAGVVEAKKAGTTLTGVEIQSDKYKHGLPDILPAWYRPLSFCYQSTGVETRFTNGFEPDYRSRNVFFFHRPETLAEWFDKDTEVSLDKAAEDSPLYIFPSTLHKRLRSMPILKEEGLWPAQIKAIQNLEKSFAENRPRALIQMATGSGKTFTAVTAIYRMIKFAGAKRVLFLVDRANLGRQTLKEFQQYVSPYSPYKFTEEYIVQQWMQVIMSIYATAKRGLYAGKDWMRIWNIMLINWIEMLWLLTRYGLSSEPFVISYSPIYSPAAKMCRKLSFMQRMILTRRTL